MLSPEPASEPKRRKPRAYWLEQTYWLAPEVEEYTRLSNTTLWRLERQGKFPARIKISEKRVAWEASAVKAYVAERTRQPAGEAA